MAETKLKRRGPGFHPRQIEVAVEASHPVGFAEGILGMKLYPKQREVMEALDPVGVSVSFRSCNEGGKTKKVIAGLILWHLAVYPKGHIITTSGSFQQIKDQLQPALHTFTPRFPAWKFLKTLRVENEMSGFWQGISKSEAGRFEGAHADGIEAPLMIIVDEAKTVKDEIFQAVERCKATRVLLASSPGYPEGEFYRSHTSRAGFYQTFKQVASECEHWKAEDIEKIRLKWGPEHPLVRSMLDAEFMAFVDDAVINLKALEDLMADPPSWNPNAGGRKAFCDFAWGGAGDENVLAVRDGNRVSIEEAFLAGDLHSICGRFVGAFTRLGLKAEEIEGDEGGGGKLVIDQLASMGWPIQRANNGSAPRGDDHYANLAAETWYEGGMKIVRREIVLPDDNDLRGQLLDRKKVFHSKGKLAIESKKDMKARGVPSPDRADAVLGCMMPGGFDQYVDMEEVTPTKDMLVTVGGGDQDGQLLRSLGAWAGER